MKAKVLRLHNAALSVDRNGLLWLTEFRHPYLNRAMQVWSRAGDWDAWTAVFGALLLSGGRARHAALKALPRQLGALALCYGLKRLARRNRPSIAVEGFSTLLSDPDPYSFPSSHSATSWSACIGLARELGGVTWLLVLHAVLVSYSRMHVGAHYPLDVLIGTSIGVSAGLVS